MKRNSFRLSLLAIVLVLCAAVQPTWAYFTDRIQADGAVQLTINPRTDLEETHHDLVKEVTVKNTGDNAVWVRAIAYVGQTFTLEVSGWGLSAPVGSGVWVYYSDPVPPGGQTEPLTVEVKTIPVSDEFIITSFNVSVQYESIPVVYDTDGNPVPDTVTAQNWTSNDLIVAGTSSPGGSGQGGN